MIEPTRYNRLFKACQAADRGRDTVPAHVDVLHDLLLEQHPVIFAADGALLRYISQKALRPHRDLHARHCRPLTDMDAQRMADPPADDTPQRDYLAEACEVLRARLMGEDVALHPSQRRMLEQVLAGGPATVVTQGNLARTRRRLHKIIRPHE